MKVTIREQKPIMKRLYESKEFEPIISRDFKIDEKNFSNLEYAIAIKSNLIVFISTLVAFSVQHIEMEDNSKKIFDTVDKEFKEIKQISKTDIEKSMLEWKKFLLSIAEIQENKEKIRKIYIRYMIHANYDIADTKKFKVVANELSKITADVEVMKEIEEIKRLLMLVTNTLEQKFYLKIKEIMFGVLKTVWEKKYNGRLNESIVYDNAFFESMNKLSETFKTDIVFRTF